MDARQLVLSPATALRAVFRTASAIAPETTARVAGRLWFTPPRPRIGESARAFLATGEARTIRVNGSDMATWSWGQGPTVALVHGWGGYGAQMQSFVQPLLSAGFRATLFDAPSHGASGPSRYGKRQSTLFEFADVLLAIADDRPLAGVIAHSGGCTAAAWAIRTRNRCRIPPMVFVAPMASPMAYISVFQNALGLSDDVVERFRANTERKLDFQWTALEVAPLAESAATPPLLVIHDREDPETPWREGAEIASAWPDAQLITTEGLGHRKILRDAQVVDAAVRFIRTRRAN
jgi:pimeloyl-ACP methyl ester carboxylesterase